MLPAFQIRSLLAADTHVASTEPGERCPIQLDEPQQYDSLISEEPATTLSYIDEDDGEIITVGSSSELYSRIDELQSLRPVVFDLFASLRSSRDSSETAAEGYRRWIQLVNSRYKGKEKEVEIIDAASEPPVTSPPPPPPPPQKPLLVAFEEELKTLLNAPQQPELTIIDAEPTAATEDSRAAPNPNDLINQAIHSIRWAGECMNKLRTDLPHRAQPAVENLNSAVHGAIVALIGQMQLIAIEATEKARQAAQSTSRQVDMNEIEAAKEKIRQLAVGIGHIAAQTAVATSSAARDIAKEVGEDVAKARRVAQEVGRDVVRGMRVESMERDTPVAPSVNSRPGSIVANVREALEKIKQVKAEKTEQEKQQEEEDAKPETPRAVRFSEATIIDAEPPKPASPTKSVADEIREAVQHIEATNHSMQQARESARSPIRATASSSLPTNEQRAIAFWEQMDKIAGHAPYVPPPPPAPAVADASDDEDTPSAPPPPPHHASNVPDGVRRSRSWHFHHHRFHNQHPIPPPLPHHLPPNWHHHHPPPPPPPPGPPPFRHPRRSRTVVGSPQTPAPPAPPPALSFFPPEPPVVHTTLPGEWPSERDEGSEKVDRCIAQLVEMGFGDAAKVRVYAQVAEGEVMEAVELLEDDRKVWEGRRRRFSERFGGIGSSSSAGGV